MSPSGPGLPIDTDAANDADAPRLVMPGRSTPAGAGVDWISKGWSLFRAAPLMWVLFFVIYLIIQVALSFVPFLGTLAGYLVAPVFAGGIALGCRAIETGGELELEHLFGGFRQGTANLLIVGVLYIVGALAILLVFGVFAGFSVVSALLAGGEDRVLETIAAATLPLILGTLVCVALFVPLMAAYWFAPMLVVMHEVKPVEAMRESFFACFRNFLAFLVYGVVLLVLLIVALIPLGLGIFVWVPLVMASTYASYRGVFTEPAASEESR
jgi:uncharacterized membrane protein